MFTKSDTNCTQFEFSGIAVVCLSHSRSFLHFIPFIFIFIQSKFSIHHHHERITFNKQSNKTKFTTIIIIVIVYSNHLPEYQTDLRFDASRLASLHLMLICVLWLTADAHTHFYLWLTTITPEYKADSVPITQPHFLSPESTIQLPPIGYRKLYIWIRPSRNCRRRALRWARKTMPTMWPTLGDHPMGKY